MRGKLIISALAFVSILSSCHFFFGYGGVTSWISIMTTRIFVSKTNAVSRFILAMEHSQTVLRNLLLKLYSPKDFGVLKTMINTKVTKCISATTT